MNQEQTTKPRLTPGAAGFILLLLILVGLVLVFLFGGPSPHSHTALITAARCQIASFRVALEAFYQDNGFYPLGTNGLKDLARQPAGATQWRGPYLDPVPKDPWGQDYIYACPGRHTTSGHPYDLISLGPPGKDSPIDNWSGPKGAEAACLQITLFEVALDAYYRDMGSYPPGPNGLSNLVRQPSGATNWHGPYLQGIPEIDYYQLSQSTNWLGFFPYLENVPKDPWGNDYIYACPGTHGPGYPYDLVSLGPPGKSEKVANREFGMGLR